MNFKVNKELQDKFDELSNIVNGDVVIDVESRKTYERFSVDKNKKQILYQCDCYEGYYEIEFLKECSGSYIMGYILNKYGKVEFVNHRIQQSIYKIKNKEKYKFIFDDVCSNLNNFYESVKTSKRGYYVLSEVVS